MADKPRDWGGLNVNFQNLPPKAGDAPLVSWLKWMGYGLAVVILMNVLSWII